jgi:hypothetical protein
MVPVFDPGNLVVVFMLCAVIGIPLSVLTVAIFFVVRQVPSVGAVPDPPCCRNHCCCNVYLDETSGSR